MKIDYFIAEAGKLEFKDNEVSEVLNTLDHLLLKHNIKQTQIIRLSIFYKPSAINNYSELLLDSIKEHFKFAIPALSILAQPPLGNGNVTIEVCYIQDSKIVVDYKKHKNVFYTLASDGKQNHIFISGLQSSNRNESIQDQSEKAFNLLEDILNLEGFKFNDIVRQWNYIEGIIAKNDDDQNYQIFNDVRTQYYNKNGLTSKYPAATGIGIKEGGIVIEVHAIAPSKDLYLAEIANPLQIDAFAYSEKVLEGKPILGFKKKTTPKFSRAKWVANSSTAQVLISGTASIHGEETIGLNDIEKQTHFTIKNIFQLIEKEHLSCINNACRIAPQLFSNVRVYVKSASDIDAVRSVCKEYFTTTNINFVVADICRENLLVEIEGVVSINLFS